MLAFWHSCNLYRIKKQTYIILLAGSSLAQIDGYPTRIESTPKRVPIILLPGSIVAHPRLLGGGYVAKTI